MDLKVLALLLIYYGLISSFFLFAGETIFADTGEYNQTFNISNQLNASAISDSEIDDNVGLFSTGISFGRFATLISFGIGLPSDTPGWFTTLFALWQSCITIFGIGWFISSIWNG